MMTLGINFLNKHCKISNDCTTYEIKNKMEYIL